MTPVVLALKKLGKKKVKTIHIRLSFLPQTFQPLLEELVRLEVEKFNEKRSPSVLIPFLDASEIQEQAETGKIDFGDTFNDKHVDEKTAIEHVLRAFEDGLFVAFVDEEEVTSLAEPITLKPDTKVTLIRMTFLVGLQW